MPPIKGRVHQSPPAPHIFLPPESQPSRDLKSLLDLRRQPGYYNAEAKIVLLRRSRNPPHDEVLVDFSGGDVQIELAAGGVPLVSGPWSWHAAAANEALISQGPWSESCWHREDDCDYLELEMRLSHGWKLERQLLLARHDRFLLLADALVGPVAECVEIRYSSSLPLASDTSFDPQRETRDGHLVVSGRQRASLVPPALAEWRAEFCHAELSDCDGRLTLRQAALGHRLFAPLWLDLDPRRLRRPLTWRRLTVAENLAVVPRDVAAAYRIQAGRDQWLIYRSLAPVGNRSVLGHNTLYSFVCLRLLPGGKTYEVLEIE